MGNVFYFFDLCLFITQFFFFFWPCCVACGSYFPTGYRNTCVETVERVEALTLFHLNPSGISPSEYVPVTLLAKV